MLRINRFSIPSPFEINGMYRKKPLSFVWFTNFLGSPHVTPDPAPTLRSPTKALLHFARGRHEVTAKLLHPLRTKKMPSVWKKPWCLPPLVVCLIRPCHAVPGVGWFPHPNLPWEWKLSTDKTWQKLPGRKPLLHPTTIGHMFLLAIDFHPGVTKLRKKRKQPRMILTQ